MANLSWNWEGFVLELKYMECYSTFGKNDRQLNLKLICWQ